MGPNTLWQGLTSGVPWKAIQAQADTVQRQGGPNVSVEQPSTSGRRRSRAMCPSLPHPPWWKIWASLVAQMVKNLPAMRETQVRSLGWEDALKKGTATQSSSLIWRIPWGEGAGRLQSTGS